MYLETLLIIMQGDKILLGLKDSKKKFGGLWNGFGGKIEKDESPFEATLREVREEAGIDIRNPEKVGEILFNFQTEEPDHYVHIFIARDYEGELLCSRDFTEYKWFGLENLPENMMPADKKWLPFLFWKSPFKGEVYFDIDMKDPKVNIYEVAQLD